MALGICQDCRNNMSDSAETCPHCGSTRRPVKTVRRNAIKTCCSCNGSRVGYLIEFRTSSDKKRIFHTTTWKNDEYFVPASRLKDIEEIKFGIAHNYILWEQVEIFCVRKIECRHCEGTGQYEGLEYCDVEI